MTAISFKSEASHYRYGNISYTYGTNDTVIFHISQSYRKSYAGFSNVVLGGTVSTENFYYGDGGVQSITLTVTSVNTTDDIFYGEATIKHHYSSTGDFTAYYASSARLSTLVNNADQNYRSQCIVQIGAAHNSSPASTVPPIVNVPDGQTLTSFSIPATEPDAQTYRYRFATGTEMGGLALTQPTVLGIAIDSVTGLVTLNTTPASVTVGQLYNAAFVVTDALGATTMVDFIIKIVQPSTPPAFNYALTPANNYVYDIQPGQAISFQVSATDIDPGDYATLTAAGLPPGATVSPSLPATGNPTATVTFSWTPTAAQLGSRIVSFIAQDVNGNQTTTNITIVTSMNPQFDVPPTLPLGSFNCLEAGSPFSTTIQAHAPDNTVTVSITSATSLPGISYSPAIPTTSGNTTSTVLSWTPTASQWGIHTLAFVATDNLGHIKNHSYDVAVNTTPTITSAIPPTTIYQNQPFSYNLTVTDPDLPYGDVIDIAGIGLPAWLTVTQTGPTTATLSGTPSAANLGSNPVQIDVEDSFHHCHVPVSQVFTLNVQSCAASFASQTATVNAAINTGACTAANVTYTAVASSAAPITYTYTFSGATSGSGSGTGSGAAFAFGTTTVDVAAATSCGTVHDIFSVIVTDNQAPTLSLPASVTVNSQDPTTTTALGTATATDNCGVQSISHADVSTQSANVNSSAHYNYTITRTWTATDVHGLVSTGNQIITVQDVTAPLVTAPSAVAVCDNGAGNTQSRTVTATDAAASPLTYAYVISGATNASGSGTTATASFNVGQSTITWTVTDVAGNINNTGVATVTIYGLPVVNIASTTNIACYGQSNGAITTSVSGGTPGYSYLWTPGNVTTPSRSGLPAGTYGLTVTDLHSCASAANVTLTQPAVLSAGTLSAAYGVPSCPAYNIYIGYGAQSVSMSSAPNGGTAPYAYSWTPAANLGNSHAISTSVIAAATTTYSLALTDAHGCATSAAYQLKVLDVRCGPTYVGRERNNTITMCHNNASACVSPTVAAGYIAANECLGACAVSSRMADHNDNGAGDNITGLIAVYPNPAHNTVNVQLSGIGSYYNAYQVIDLTGKLVAQQAAESGIAAEVLTIDVSHYIPGMYLIRVAGKDNTTAIARFTVD